MVDDLADNNVLRGAWAEELVAHFLAGSTFPGQWNYYDLMAVDGLHTISIKHATGTNPRFVVPRRKWAWDNRLAETTGFEGWRGGDHCPAQYWCDIYIFAWLDPPLDRGRVLDPGAWRFVVLSRGAMCRTMTEDRKTVTVGRLLQITARLVGSELHHAVAAALAEIPGDDIPQLDLRPYETVTATCSEVCKNSVTGCFRRRPLHDGVGRAPIATARVAALAASKMPLVGDRHVPCHSAD